MSLWVLSSACPGELPGLGTLSRTLLRLPSPIPEGLPHPTWPCQSHLTAVLRVLILCLAFLSLSSCFKESHSRLQLKNKPNKTEHQNKNSRQGMRHESGEGARRDRHSRSLLTCSPLFLPLSPPHSGFGSLFSGAVLLTPTSREAAVGVVGGARGILLPVALNSTALLLYLNWGYSQATKGTQWTLSSSAGPDFGDFITRKHSAGASPLKSKL